jgi:hypothetical protein
MQLPRVAMASMRSKAGKQGAHEQNSPDVLKAAARKLLDHSGDGSGSVGCWEKG